MHGVLSVAIGRGSENLYACLDQGSMPRILTVRQQTDIIVMWISCAQRTQHRKRNVHPFGFHFQEMDDSSAVYMQSLLSNVDGEGDPNEKATSSTGDENLSSTVILSSGLFASLICVLQLLFCYQVALFISTAATS